MVWWAQLIIKNSSQQAFNGKDLLTVLRALNTHGGAICRMEAAVAAIVKHLP